MLNFLKFQNRSGIAELESPNMISTKVMPMAAMRQAGLRPSPLSCDVASSRARRDDVSVTLDEGDIGGVVMSTVK